MDKDNQYHLLLSVLLWLFNSTYDTNEMTYEEWWEKKQVCI